MARPKNTALCSVENCGKLVYGKGMCRPHWWRMHRYGRTHKVVKRGVYAVCTVEGCGETKIKGHGLCLIHYRQYHHKFRVYEIDHARYIELINEQNNLCAICRKAETSLFRNIPGKIKQLAIDHNHKTGKVRGLLCWKCNSMLGRVQENVDLIRAMIDYLNKHKEAENGCSTKSR
jgi:hypothetical protein